MASPQASTCIQCPNCSASFPCAEAVVQHLSSDCACRAFAHWEPTSIESNPDGEDDDDTFFTHNGKLQSSHSVSPGLIILIDDDELATDLECLGLDGLDGMDEECGDSFDDSRHGRRTSSSSHSTPFHRTREYHPNQSKTHSGGENLFGRMDQDEFTHIRDTENPYYPFASKSEWEVANWLSRETLSQREIDEYLQLDRVCVFDYCRNRY